MRNIELKRISYNERLSEETFAYAADVYLDGRLFASVSNDGHGGCDMQHPANGFTYKDLEALNAEIKATYPKETHTDLTIKGEPLVIEPDLEHVCHGLLMKWLEAKDNKRIDNKIKRELEKTVVYYDPARCGIFTIKKNAVAQFGKVEMIRAVKRKFPYAKVLNEMPIDEAVALYREKAA